MTPDTVLSFKIFMLGSNIPKRNQLSDVAHPFMFRLAELTQENVNLAIMYEQKVLYIKKIESSTLSETRPADWQNRSTSLHCFRKSPFVWTNG